MTPEESTPEDEDRLDEEAFWRKLHSVPRGVVERALTLYVLLSSRDTPAWVRALVLAALAYLINPLDACPDVLPGIGLTDDLAVLALALERLSRYVTPEVEALCAHLELGRHRAGHRSCLARLFSFVIVRLPALVRLPDVPGEHFDPTLPCWY